MGIGMNEMGVTNVQHGVCGFTSSLYALYARSPRPSLVKGAQIETRMMAEIKTYLTMLKADGRADLLAAIKEFTNSFPGYGGFTIDGYIQQINAAVTQGVSNFSIAMPPAVVVDYLQRACEFKTAKEVDLSAGGVEFILGVRDSNGKSDPLKGLIHWVYYLNGTVYSWGKQFPNGNEKDSVAAAGKSQSKTYQVVYKIVPGT